MLDQLSIIALYVCFAGGGAFALAMVGLLFAPMPQASKPSSHFMGDASLYLYVFGGVAAVVGGIAALALRALALHV